MRIMCKSKIHRARITDSNLNYVGSITLDENLIEASNLIEYEQVHVLNINTGDRFITYVIKGKRGSGEVCVNGAASRYVQKDDLVIILGYSYFDEKSLLNFKPAHIYVDEENRIVSSCQELLWSEKQAIVA